jgi:hypothetical protein
VAGEGVVCQSCCFAFLCFGEALAFAIEHEVGIIDEGHAMSAGEVFSAGPDEVDVLALFEDQTGRLDGIAQMFDTGNAAGLHAATVHEKRVKLHTAIGGKEAAAPRIEGRVIFEDSYGGFYCVEGWATAREDVVASFKGIAHSGFVGRLCVGGDCPGTAMNDQDWSHQR